MLTGAALADRLGNRPFMVAGLILQAGGLAWLAASTHPGVGFGWPPERTMRLTPSAAYSASPSSPPSSRLMAATLPRALFIAGFRPAEWTAAAVAGVGVLAAVLAPGRVAVAGSA